MRTVTIVIALLLLLTHGALAAEWDTIKPGESTQAAVRAQFGQPTKVTSQKVEGYDSAQWVYEGEQSPRGMVRVTVDFGLLTPQGYKADIVRTMLLQPKPGAFTRESIVLGWGAPQGVKTEDGAESIFYAAGLIIRFDKEGRNATSMLFTPPQKLPEESAPKRP
jgi:hypothetical protein